MTVALSVVVPTLNEGRRLATALQSVAWSDDVIVVDAGSTDDTLEVAGAHQARTVSLVGHTIGAQRNAGIALARHRWVLALDADEIVADNLRESLTRLAANGNAGHSAFRVRSRNWHLGRELRHGPWGNDWKVRVFDNEQRFSDARVHENLVGSANVGTLPGDLIHHPYDDLAHQVTKIAKYARWAAQDMRDRGQRASTLHLLTRPPARFIRDYLLLGGWRDGRAGFIVSVTSAFSVFCKYASFLSG